MAKFTLPYLRDRFQYLFPKFNYIQDDFMFEIEDKLAFWGYIGSDYKQEVGNRRI